MADFSDRRFKMNGGDEIPPDADRNSKKVEIGEWKEVNRQLRKHGLKGIKVFPATDVPVSSGRYVCLDPESNVILQQNLLTLLADANHKQTLLHDLMEANKELKDEVASLTDRADQLLLKSKDLKIMLECSRKRVEELELERSNPAMQMAGETQKGCNLRNAIQKRCKDLEEAFMEKDVKLDRLQKKMQLLTEAEEKRQKKQSRAFFEFRNRKARAHSVADGKLLDVIDIYERQLSDLRRELEMMKRGESRLQKCKQELQVMSSKYETGQKAKFIIKELEHRLKDAEKKLRSLADEKNGLAHAVETRPQQKEYHLALQRVKKLERLLSLHKISIPGEKKAQDSFLSRQKYSTKLEALDYLPVEFCQQHLRDLCSELGVEDIEQLLPVIRDLIRRLEHAERYREFCHDLQHTIDSLQNVSHASHPRRPGNSKSDTAVNETTIRKSLNVIENWHEEMIQLQALREALNCLLQNIMPQARIHFTSSHTMADMVEIIDRLTEEETTTVTQEGFEHISRSTLEKIVKHFQDLFDVPSVTGVLTRMTEIYQHFGEAQNVLHTLKNLLGLASDENSSSVVDAITKLCQAHNSTTSQQLKQLFETDDLGSIIRKLDEHAEFFPAFKETICKLFEILNVKRMDQVVPAVRALKLLAS